MFGGPCPPFSFGDTDACGAWPALLGAGGGSVSDCLPPRLSRGPRSPAGCVRLAVLWVLAPQAGPPAASWEAPLGSGSSPPGPGAGWAPAVLSEATGSTGRFGVTMQPGQQGPGSGRPL